MMEESSKLTEKCKNVTASEFPELKLSPSSDLNKEVMPHKYSSEKRNTSSQNESETLTPQSAERLNRSELCDSTNVSKLSKSTGGRTVLTSSIHSDSKTSDKAMSEIEDTTDDFKKLFEKHETALHRFSTSDSRTSHKTSIESSKKTKRSKSNKRTKNSRRDAQGSSRTKVCNLQTLISNEETREIGLFYSSLAGLDIDSSQSGKSFCGGSRPSHAKSIKNIKASETDNKSRSSEIDKKSKSSHLDRRSKSSDLDRKSTFSEVDRKYMSAEVDKISKSSEVAKKTKSSELNIKSKGPQLGRKSKSSISSKETRTIETPVMSALIRDLQEIKLPETNVIDKATIGEGASASIKSNMQDFPDCSTNYFDIFSSLFNPNKATPPSSESSDSGTLTPGSDDLDSRTNLECCKSLKKLKPAELQTTTSNLSSQSSKSNIKETSSKSKLTRNTLGSKPSEKSVKSKLSIPSGTLKLPDLPETLKSSDSSVIPKSSDTSVIPKSPDSSVRSKFSDPSVRSKFSDPSVRSKFSDPSVRSKFSDPSVRSKFSDPSVRSKFSDPSVKSEFSDPSVKSEFSDPSVKSEFSDPSVRSKLLDSSMRSKFPDSSVKSKFPKPSSKLSYPSVRSKLDKSHEKSDEGAVHIKEPSSQQYMADRRLKRYVLSRHPYFLELQSRAERVEAFMNKVNKLKDDYIKVNKSRLKEADASDWLKLFYYWDLAIKEIRRLIEAIRELYESDEIFYLRYEECPDFMRHILNVFRDILELICLCQNGHAKYKKFCSSHDMNLFLFHVITFESHASSLFKKLRTESELFTLFKKNESN